MDSDWECIVVGGGAAGLSAALVLGRARRRVLVVDAGRQSNRAAHRIGGLLGSDGRPPADFYAAAAEELAAYPNVEVRSGEVRSGRRDDVGFSLELGDGAREGTARILLATGMDYRYPDLAGIEERWGGTVFHCPFCHGWEVREKALGVLDRGADGAHRAQLLRVWSDDVTLYAGGPAELDAGDAARLTAAGVTIDERPVTGLRGARAGLEAVVLGDEERACDALLVPVSLHQRSTLHEQLGAASVETPLAPAAVQVDARNATSVPGLFAAGDVTGAMPSVANSVAAGGLAAAMIVQEIAAG